MNKRAKMDMEAVRAYIEASSAESKIYLGCDSERIRVDGKWHADYIRVVVIHIDGCRGCKIFGEVDRQIDYDQRKDRPIMRLMNEVYAVAGLFAELADVLEGRDFAIHLDINPDEMHGSSCAVAQAVGYIKGTCNVVPFLKPDAFSASYAADRWKQIRPGQERTSRRSRRHKR